LSGYLSLSLSHRLIHHQRPGALQYIYYIGYVLVIVVRDIKGVDGEEEEEREQSKVQYTLLKCMYLFFSLSSLWSFSLSLFRIFLLCHRNACQRPRQNA
jgi:hypothetical protein